MKTSLKNMANCLLALTVLGVLLGAVMVIWPDMSLTAFGIIAAVFFFIIGLSLIILDVKAWRMYIPFDGFIPGVLNVILGVIFACYPEFFAVYVGTAFGLLLIVLAFSGIKFAVKIRGTGAPWLLIVILQVINVLAGILMICYPVSASISLTVVLGILLMIFSVSNFVTLISVKKNVKSVNTLIVNALSAPEKKDAE